MTDLALGALSLLFRLAFFFAEAFLPVFISASATVSCPLALVTMQLGVSGFFSSFSGDFLGEASLLFDCLVDTCGLTEVSESGSKISLRSLTEEDFTKSLPGGLLFGSASLLTGVVIVIMFPGV